MPYMCAKFERNRSTRRMSLVGLNLLYVKKCKENRAIFWNTYFVNYWADYLQIWYVGLHIYMEGIKCEFDRNCPSGYRDMRG